MTSASSTPLTKRITLSAVVSLLMLLLAELVLQLAVPEPVTIRFAQDIDELSGMQLVSFAGVLVNDPDRFWRLSPGTTLPENGGPFFGVIANGQGFREDHAIDAVKGDNELRILFLGDSCTFGFGVGQSETFVERCEQRLAKGRPGQAIECINGGVPGYTIYQGWSVLASWGDRLQADVVVVCFGFNDRATWDGLGDLEHARATPAGPLRHSRLARLLWPPPQSKSTGNRARVTPREYRGLLMRLQERVQQLGARLVLVSWCERFQITDARDDPHTAAEAESDTMRQAALDWWDSTISREARREERTPWQFELYKYAKRHDVPLVDLVPRVQEWADEADKAPLFLDIVHATPEAHSRIAEVISRTLDPVLDEIRGEP